mgnify:CR=1 FL=1
MTDRDIQSALPDGVVAADTITLLPPEAEGAVVVSGSHGGIYPGQLALAAGARAVILNDAGGGRDGAGYGSLALCEAAGVAAAVVAHDTCRIGETGDMLARGRISRANALAAAAGVSPGMTCLEAARLLTHAPLASGPRAKPGEEARRILDLPGPGRIVVLCDSASLVGPEDAGRIVVTGSHGGLIGNNPAKALKADAFAAVFNDAGVGADGWGITRLPVLDARGVAAFTVSTDSARIGDALSSFEDGIVSHVNERAAALGIAAGMAARDAIIRLRALDAA